MDDGFLVSDEVASNISGEDDEEDLRVSGTGIIVTNSGENEADRPSYFSKRRYCVNCRKGIHNTPDNDSRCKGKGCDCRCQTHYIGLDGRVRPYGIPDDSNKKECRKETTAGTDEIGLLVEQWRKLHSSRR